MGQTYETGISNGSHFNSKDTFTEASASFLYGLTRKYSEYTFDYAGAARHYRRSSGLDVVSQSAGLAQSVHWTPRLNTFLGYRYTFSPDFATELLQESITRDISLRDPLVDSQPLVFPAEPGVVRLRSLRMVNSAQAGLSYQPSFNTRVLFKGGFERVRYQDDSLFGGESASLSGQVERTLSARTAAGLNYEGNWYHQSGSAERMVVHNGTLSLSRQLTAHMTISVSGGRSWSYSDGKTSVPLSPTLSDLLGTPFLLRNGSRSFSSWIGGANLLTHWQWKKVNFGVTYDRSITNSNLLERPAQTQSVTFNAGRQLGKFAIISGSVVYQQNKFFTLQNVGRIDQGVVVVEFSRRLASGLNFSIFYNGTRLLKGAVGPITLDNTRTGIRLSYQFPSMRPS